jgi:hypothetical protein
MRSHATTIAIAAMAAVAQPARAQTVDSGLDLVSPGLTAPPAAAAGFTTTDSCLPSPITVPVDAAMNPCANFAGDSDLAGWKLPDPQAPKVPWQASGGVSGLGQVTEGPASAGPDGPDAGSMRWADHVNDDQASHPGFWGQVGSVKTEALLFLGYFSIQGGRKLFRETEPFHFKDEGWFGKNTSNIGVDKLTHAFDTYLLAEFFHQQMHRRTKASKGDAVAAAVLASALMTYNELSDGIETTSGFSVQDVAFNLAGAGFSVLRNTVPGLKEKVAFKIEIVPNKNIYSYEGKPHFEQQRFFFAIKGAGFSHLERSPLRYVDLQIGYFASDFLNSDRAAGREPKRHIFVGLGLNLGELLFGKADSGFGRAGYKVLDYLQLPYTSLRYDTTGRLGH